MLGNKERKNKWIVLARANAYNYQLSRHSALFFGQKKALLDLGAINC